MKLLASANCFCQATHCATPAHCTVHVFFFLSSIFIPYILSTFHTFAFPLLKQEVLSIKHCKIELLSGVVRSAAFPWKRLLHAATMLCMLLVRSKQMSLIFFSLLHILLCSWAVIMITQCCVFTGDKSASGKIIEVL